MISDDHGSARNNVFSLRVKHQYMLYKIYGLPVCIPIEYQLSRGEQSLNNN